MCVFCKRIENKDYLRHHGTVVLMSDMYPVTEGHALVVPVRCVPNFFHLTPNEHGKINDLLYWYAEELAMEYDDVDGYNIGWNVGGSAGATINHAHCHFIPRRTGDCENPVGGVRKVIPEMGDYLS
jgi:diadenosine tetraphosphate (Ap4A) HIT family hydrolase